MACAKLLNPSRIYHARRAWEIRLADTRLRETRYVDAAELTGLFARNANNRKRRLIIERLFLMARGITSRYARFYWLPLDDIASDAAMAATAKIWHYTQNCRHQNAFSYFTRLLFHEVAQRVRVESNLAKGLPPFIHKSRRKPDTAWI